MFSFCESKRKERRDRKSLIQSRGKLRFVVRRSLFLNKIVVIAKKIRALLAYVRV